VRGFLIVVTFLLLGSLVAAGCGTSDDESDEGATVDDRSVTVVAFGEASAPATRVELQFVVTLSNSDGAEMTVESLQPVVDAVVATGVEASAVRASIESSPYGKGYGPMDGPYGQVLVEIDPFTRDQVDQIVEAVEGVDNLTLAHTGALYGVEDCASLRQAAIDGAVADARQRAAALASPMSGDIGAMTGIADEGYGFGPSGPNLCEPTPAVYGMMEYPPLGLGQPPEVVATPVLRITFAVE
jgi:uncharacterized protein YggE